MPFDEPDHFVRTLRGPPVAAAMFGAWRQTMVEALTRARRPSRERVIEVLWRQVAASVGIDPEASLAAKPGA